MPLANLNQGEIARLEAARDKLREAFVAKVHAARAEVERGAPEPPGAGAPGAAVRGRHRPGARRERAAHRRGARAGRRQRARSSSRAQDKVLKGAPRRHRDARLEYWKAVFDLERALGARSTKSKAGRSERHEAAADALGDRWRSSSCSLWRIVLFATGRLELHWRPATQADRPRKDEHGHDQGKKEEGHAEEGRRPGRQGRPRCGGGQGGRHPERAGRARDRWRWRSTLTARSQVPDERIAHVTPRVSGVVREICRPAATRLRRATPLAVIESAELGEARGGVRRRRRGRRGGRERTSRPGERARQARAAARQRGRLDRARPGARRAGHGRHRTRPWPSATSIAHARSWRRAACAAAPSCWPRRRTWRSARARAEAAERRIARPRHRRRRPSWPRARQRARRREGEAPGPRRRGGALAARSGVTRPCRRSAARSPASISATGPHRWARRSSRRRRSSPSRTSARCG